MSIICTLINGAALIYGGAVDFKKREIPNLVPVTLLVTGILQGGSVLRRLVEMGIIVCSLLLTGKITKQRLPGGDFKLISALAFSSGILVLLGTLFWTGIGAVAESLTRRMPVRRNIPLCTYVAAAYFVTFATFFI